MSDPLAVLLEDGVIDEVLGRLKSGKEADISLIRRGDEVIAAKVYKDRTTRSFKNNTDYKEGRKVRNSRTQRAMDKGGQFGRDFAEQAWKSAEADALYKLVDSGVRVPVPRMFYEGVLLMELVRGVDGGPAPRLIDTHIDRADAMSVYADLVAQMIAMLCCDLIHGDLSPYNILASADGPVIIDFPQVIFAAHNTRAEFFFLRDFDNVLQFLASIDPALSVHRGDGRAIWRAYVSRDLTPQFVPPPPQLREPQRRRDGGRPNHRGPNQANQANQGPRPPQGANPQRSNPQRSNPQRPNPPRSNPQRSNPQQRSGPSDRSPPRRSGPPSRSGPPQQQSGAGERPRDAEQPRWSPPARSAPPPRSETAAPARHRRRPKRRW